MRPTLTSSRPTVPALTALTTPRASSTTPSVPTEDPKVKAKSILDALPGNSLVSKTAILSSAAGLSIYALSNEYYVVNEETVVAFLPAVGLDGADQVRRPAVQGVGRVAKLQDPGRPERGARRTTRRPSRPALRTCSRCRA